MKSGRPITPDEAKTKSDMPAMVFDAWNSLIAKNLTGQTSVVKQRDAVALLVAIMDVERAAVFANGWLEIEDPYRLAGWTVEYDKPGFNETYDASYTFRCRD